MAKVLRNQWIIQHKRIKSERTHIKLLLFISWQTHNVYYVRLVYFVVIKLVAVSTHKLNPANGHLIYLRMKDSGK